MEDAVAGHLRRVGRTADVADIVEKGGQDDLVRGSSLLCSKGALEGVRELGHRLSDIIDFA